MGIHSLYKIEDDKLVRLRKECPKCAGGTFMAAHKDRVACGKCGYAEFESASS